MGHWSSGVRLKGLDEVSRNWGAPGPRRKSRYERCERCGGLCEGLKLAGGLLWELIE